MKYVWKAKILEWNPDLCQYVERYTSLHSSSIKARKECLHYCKDVKFAKDVDVNNRSKEFYTVTSNDRDVHCIVTKENVW